jgi:hypothetical protein
VKLCVQVMMVVLVLLQLELPAKAPPAVDLKARLPAGALPEPVQVSVAVTTVAVPAP